MSLFRTPHPRQTLKLQLAVIAPAIAVIAAVAGTVGAWPGGAAAQPAAIARPAGFVRQATPDSARLLPASPAMLDRSAMSAGSARNQAQLDAVLATSASAKGTTASTESATAVKAATAVLTAKVTKKVSRTPRQTAISLLHKFGWSKWQFRFLNPLWARESGWRVHAENVYSGAYGIPQAVPGSKMATAGRYWRSSARTQIMWGLRYIKGRYGSPERAWEHELATGWY